MSPVDRAGSVSEISPRFFSKILIYSYEKLGWPSYRDISSHMNIPARILALSTTKHFQVCMACKLEVADKSERSSTGIWGGLLDIFHLGNRD